MLANLQKFCYSFKPEGNATKVPDPSHWDGGEWIAPASFDSLCDQYLPPSCATPGKATQCYRFLSFIARQYDPDICAAALSGQCEDVCDHQCPSPPPPSATALVASGSVGQPSGQGVKQALFCAGGSCYDRSTTAPLTAFNDDAAASADRTASMRKVAPGDAHGQRLLRRVPEQVGAAHAPDASTVPRVVALTTKDAGRFGPFITKGSRSRHGNARSAGTGNDRRHCLHCTDNESMHQRKCKGSTAFHLLEIAPSRLNS